MVRPANGKARPRVAVVKFASCDGCQLTLLDAEDELLSLAESLDFVHFAEASSRLLPGPYDVALVEGSITTAQDVERIQVLRDESRLLITIGACATAGGVQALRNFADMGELVQAVYARPEHIRTLATSTPISAHVAVDFELPGCPIDRGQLLGTLQAVLAGRMPRLAREPVCTACKRRGVVCVTVAQGLVCLGPITQAGCGALCPAYQRGCFGCFGPAATANPAAWATELAAPLATRSEIIQLLQPFHGATANALAGLPAAAPTTE